MFSNAASAKRASFSRAGKYGEIARPARVSTSEASKRSMQKRPATSTMSAEQREPGGCKSWAAGGRAPSSATSPPSGT
jgi:hypothetical protein